MSEETICTIALTCIPKVSKKQALELYKYMGNTAIPLFSEDKNQLRKQCKELPVTLLHLILEGREKAYLRAQKEWAFIQQHQI